MAVKSRAIAPSSPHPFDLSHPGTPSDIIVFCATIILLNALDFQAYTYPKKSTSSHDINAIPLPERITCTYARGQAKILAKWALKQYDLQRQDQPNVSAFTTVFLPYLAQLRDTLLLYKERAISFGLRGPAGCTILRLKAQVDSCFSVVDLPTGDSSHGPRMLETLACGRKVFTFAFKNLEERLFHEMGTDTLTFIELYIVVNFHQIFIFCLLGSQQAT